MSGFRIHSANRFENRAYDHVAFGANGDPLLQFEVTLLSWRNHHYTDVFAEKGSAHISSLCKWGPSTFIARSRWARHYNLALKTLMLDHAFKFFDRGLFLLQQLDQTRQERRRARQTKCPFTNFSETQRRRGH